MGSNRVLGILAASWAVAMPAWADADLPKAGTATDVAQDIALLEGVIKAKARDPSSAEEVTKAYARIAQLQEKKGDQKGAAHARDRMAEWYDAQNHPKDGGPLATMVAEARYRNLEMLAAGDLNRKLTADGKPVADAKKVWESWHEATVGALKWVPPLVAPAKPLKGKPLCEQLLALRAYNALPWTRAGHWLAGRVAMALSREVAGLAALEAAEKQAELVEAGKQYAGLAADWWERSWKESDVAGQRDHWANEIRKELSVIKPAEYPPIEKVEQETLTPQQQEASKLAALAQRTDKLQLRVLYLRKAVGLDPSNVHLKELLKQAETEYAEFLKKGG